ncbi:MAG: carboxypeptidase-like regulatory domain-containing protein [Flavobacteriales bacterium]
MKTIIKKSLLALFVFSGNSVLAQGTHGEIHGKVYEAETKEPIPSATVYVKVGDQLIGTTTDTKGRFTLKPLNPGNYDVKIKFMGKHEKTITGVSVNPNEISFVKDVYLEDDDKILIETNVVWYKDLIKKDDPTVTVIRTKEIMAMPVARNMPALLGTMPGFQLAPNGRDINVRGARSGDIVFFLDGVKQFGSMPAIPAVSISSISTYPSGIPAKYGDVTGGVVVIETKSYFEILNERQNQ